VINRHWKAINENVVARPFTHLSPLRRR
jgi:hypothetical protein